MRLVCRCPFKVRREAQRLPTHIHATRTHRRPLVLVPQCVSRTTRTNRWRPRVKQRLSFPRLPPVPVDSSRCICVPMAHSVDPTHVVGIWVGRRRTMSAGRAQRLPSTDKLSQSKQLQISVAIFASAQRHNVGARSVGPMRNANGRRTYICAIGGRARWHAHLSGSTEHDQERTIVRSGTTGRAGIARVHRGRLLAPNDRRTSRRCRRDDAAADASAPPASAADISCRHRAARVHWEAAGGQSRRPAAAISGPAQPSQNENEFKVCERSK